jgi:hypothetical protein
LERATVSKLDNQNQYYSAVIQIEALAICTHSRYICT